MRQSNLSIMIYTPKLDLGKEFLSRIAELRDLLRFGPTFKIRNKDYLEFINGTRIKIASTISRLRGQNCDLMIIDEAAFIQDPEDFLYCAIPTYASSPNCQMIFLSTPRGRDNYLNEIYVKAHEHKNEFVASRMYADDIPDRAEKEMRYNAYLSMTDMIREVLGIFWGYDRKFRKRKM